MLGRLALRVHVHFPTGFQISGFALRHVAPRSARIGASGSSSSLQAFASPEMAAFTLAVRHKVGPDAAWGPAGGGDRGLKSRENLSVAYHHIRMIVC